jgi:tetratricopeptide (TPR) repeat protein
LLDEIDALIPNLEAIGANIQPELGRWDGVQGSVQRYANDLLRELKPVGGLAKVRDEQPEMPPQEHLWWWLDVASREHAVKRIRKTAIWVAVVAIVVVGGIWLFQTLFPVDPLVKESYRLQIAADQLILDEGDPALILQYLEEAAALTPGQMDIQSMLVVLYEEQGNLDRADAIRQQLFDAFSESDVYAQLAQTYFERSDYEKALGFARTAFEINPDNVMPYMTAGLTAEAMGDRRAAVGYLTEASEIAARIDDAELQAIARIQLAQIMQSPPQSLFPSTPVP